MIVDPYRFGPGVTYDADALQWKANVIAGGFTVSDPTFLAVDTLAKSLKTSGAWSAWTIICPVAGSAVGAAGYYLKYPGATAAATQNGTAATYNETGASGGVRGNGSNTYWNTNYNPSAAGDSHSSFGVWAWHKTTGTAGTSMYTIAAMSSAGTNEVALGWLQSGSQETGSIAVGSAGQRIPISATGQTGLMGIQTNGSRTQTGYLNGSAIAGTFVASGSFASLSLFFMSGNNNGSPGVFSSRRYGIWGISTGQSSQQISDSYTAFAAFETAMSR